MKLIQCLLLSLWTATSICLGADWFVSTNGSGNGSITNPWSLTVAMVSTNSVPQAGDTIWLRGGTYGVGTNIYTCWLANTNSSLVNPITFRQYPGERAIINGGIASYSSNIVFRDFEITCSVSSRTNTPTGRPEGLNLLGLANHAINLVIHDTGHPAIGFWNPAGNGGEIYGCIIYYTGLYDTSMTNTPIRGSGIYMQNQNGNPLVSDVITFKNFTTGMKAYTQGGWANGFRWHGNVAFYDNSDSGFFLASFDNPATDIVVSSNYTFDCMFSEFGHYDGCPDVHDITLIGNYFVGVSSLAAQVHKVDSLLVTNNTFVNVMPVGSSASSSPIFSLIPATNTPISSVGDYNNYLGGGELIYSGDTIPLRFNSFAVSWSAWKTNTGWDTHSYYSTNLPTTNVVVVRANKYESGRAHIIVYNWESNSVVNVDISGIGLSQGQHFEVRDVQNYFGTPALTGTYDPASPSITLPLTLTNCAVFVGTQTHMLHDPNKHTSSLFNVFVIFRDNSSYLLTICTNGPGTVTGATNGLYVFGTNITLTAQPSPYCYFVNWTGTGLSGSDTNEVLSFTMDQAKTITANFAGSGVLGDVDSNGSVTAYDAALVARYAVGYTDADFKNAAAADVDGDGNITAYDAALIAQRAVGLKSKFPVEP